MTTSESENESPTPFRSKASSLAKVLFGSALVFSAVTTYKSTNDSRVSMTSTGEEDGHRRRLAADGESNYTPQYMNSLFQELSDREKLFQDTPPEEIKYWFEYTGPLQKYYYRYSKSRGKADSFEGRDDSGVTSARFYDSPGSGSDFEDFFNTGSLPTDEVPFRTRLLKNCLAMGDPKRPKAGQGSFWYDWFGGESGEDATMDRCRVLFVMNTVGAGKGPTMLWETNPPTTTDEPQPWMSEQATAATAIERNLKEINHMCETGQIAARVQVLVCEPIPGKWTDWMDSMLVSCGGKESVQQETKEGENPYESGIEVEERPSPVQVVVVSNAETADTCHDLKSGFMEQRMKDLVLAPPFIGDDSSSEKSLENFDPSVKTTHPDLISSDGHDVYVAFKWSSLVTVRSVASFLQSSADLAAAAASPRNSESSATGSVTLSDQPSSPFLIPSFVRVSYVSEENNKVAKWRMHGDFFHPAAWEVCKDSFDMTWIPDSLSSGGGVSDACSKTSTEEDCGQWWVFMAEEQMPTNPEIYASEASPPIVRGGSNFIWMLTETQRKKIVSKQVCDSVKSLDKKDSSSLVNECGQDPQAVIPLGDLESHLSNYMPNTALGKKHESGRRPGYSKGDKLEKDREKVRERKQLKGQEDIEKALFDYTIYPAALFRKDATLRAVRSRDASLSGEPEGVVPKMIMSDYYDVTITKPRQPLPSWCQDIARRGLCSLHADYMRETSDRRCWEACGMSRNWKSISSS